jgi:molybdopterin biosynthesis enzyme MoaB
VKKSIIKTGIITVSDRVHVGVYEDISGKAIIPESR